MYCRALSRGRHGGIISARWRIREWETMYWQKITPEERRIWSRGTFSIVSCYSSLSREDSGIRIWENPTAVPSQEAGTGA